MLTSSFCRYHPFHTADHFSIFSSGTGQQSSTPAAFLENSNDDDEEDAAYEVEPDKLDEEEEEEEANGRVAVKVEGKSKQRNLSPDSQRKKSSKPTSKDSIVVSDSDDDGQVGSYPGPPEFYFILCMPLLCYPCSAVLISLFSCCVFITSLVFCLSRRSPPKASGKRGHRQR